MKKNTIIQLIFALCIIALFVLHFTDRNRQQAVFNVSQTDSAGHQLRLPIAYVNVDTLLLNYNYSKDLNETLLRKRENAQATLNQKARQLETEMSEFQRKYENNAFLSQQSFQSQQQRLQRKQADLQKLEESLTKELLQEQQEMNQTLRDTIYSFLARYNARKKYQIILSNSMNDNIMLADPAYNITNEITKELNRLYTPKED
jgi:outer membrane protein